MVVISPCMKAQGTLEPARRQRSPLGQKTSLLVPCFLMDSAEHGKQNLWWEAVGHWKKENELWRFKWSHTQPNSTITIFVEKWLTWTKCVSSNLWAHRVHFKRGLLGRPSPMSEQRLKQSDIIRGLWGNCHKRRGEVESKWNVKLDETTWNITCSKGKVRFVWKELFRKVAKVH